MTITTRRAVGAVHSSFLAACSIGGIRVALAPPDAGGVSELARGFEAATTEVKRFATESKTKLQEFDARLSDVEQKGARRAGGGLLETKSWGQSLVDSEQFKALAGSAEQRGKARIEVETKNILSTVGSGGALIAPDYRVAEPVGLPQKRLAIRNLVAPGQTNSNMVFWSRQTARTNNAASVAEGALKPKSEMTYELVQSPVVTIAHFTKTSRQMLDDAPAMQSMIDSELRYGLAEQEDSQLLFGNGTGQNLGGLMGYAAAFAAPFTSPAATPLDRIIQAVAQSELALFPASGMVLNPVDWYRMISIKDTTGAYLSAGPFGPADSRRLWDLPCALTTQMPQGSFLVGAFALGAQIYDRLTATVMISTENEDDFIHNLVTVLCEERLAFAVKRPTAFVKGQLVDP